MERRWVLDLPWLSTLGLESAMLCVKQPVCWCIPMPESLLTLLKKEDIYLNENKKKRPPKHGQIPQSVNLL